MKTNIKRRAGTTKETTQQVLAGELMGVLAARRGDIPVLPQTYQTNSTGEQYLLFDNGVGDAERLFIFASPQAIQLLTQFPH